MIKLQHYLSFAYLVIYVYDYRTSDMFDQKQMRPYYTVNDHGLSKSVDTWFTL